MSIPPDGGNYEGVRNMNAADALRQFFAPAQVFDANERLFRQIIGSFAPLTDPQILSIQPNRVDIVRRERNMNLRSSTGSTPL